jgi:hypothetical protein
MSYTKQNFKSGEKLYASDLNEMDEQIHQNTESISKLSEDKADKAEIPTDEHINELINVALGVVENGTY